MFTLNTIERHAVCYAIENHPHDSRIKIEETNTFQTLSAKCGTGGGNTPLALIETDREYVIRRITPVECARLQGFPDWWTDGVEGSDSAKYKMWGNGIALPCAADVLGRIAKECQSGNNFLLPINTTKSITQTAKGDEYERHK